VKPRFEQQFTVYAIARRGRGETDTTAGHSLEDESGDVVAVMQSIGAPVFLLGHSYGAQTALAAAAHIPARVRKLVLYEPAWPRVVGPEALARLEALAQAGDWDGLAVTFFRDQLSVPVEELNALRATALWQSIIVDAQASLGDLRALSRTTSKPSAFASCASRCCSRSAPKALATSTLPTPSPPSSRMSASRSCPARRTKG
jgi:pimeloyl-ACP methyl ester carboxylesterase